MEIDNIEQQIASANQVDLECAYFDDDASSFGSMADTSEGLKDDDNRNFNPRTGVIIDLSDDYPEPQAQNYGSFSEEKNDLSLDFDGSPMKKKVVDAYDPNEFTGYNSIDTETDYPDDTEYYDSSKDDDFSTEFGLIPEDLNLTEKKKPSFGEVEDDYWEKLQKKHAKSNKKGAYNTYFHLAGNPEKEMELFNHDMTPSSALGDLNSSSFAADGGSSIISGASEGCCESLNEEFSEKDIADLFNLLGFEIIKIRNSPKLICRDRCGEVADYESDSLADICQQLEPYIDYCITYPLISKSNQHFNTHEDWINWYDAEAAKRYPKCKDEIDACKILKYISKGF